MSFTSISFLYCASCVLYPAPILARVQILEHHAWMTNEHPSWVQRLWAQVAGFLHHRTKTKGGLAGTPGERCKYIEPQAFQRYSWEHTSIHSRMLVM